MSLSLILDLILSRAYVVTTHIWRKKPHRYIVGVEDIVLDITLFDLKWSLKPDILR